MPRVRIVLDADARVDRLPYGRRDQHTQVDDEQHPPGPRFASPVHSQDEDRGGYRDDGEDRWAAARKVKDGMRWMTDPEQRIDTPDVRSDGVAMHSPEQEKEDPLDQEQGEGSLEGN